MTSQPGKQTITMYIFPNNLRSKGSRTMIFCQLIKYNKIKIFLEKSLTKCDGDTIPKTLFSLI